MTLTLTIANVDRLENGESPNLVLDKHGAVIGRSPNADWSLPDPKKHISYTHCEISYRNGEYILADRSTNGTFLNGSSERMTAPHTLAGGDEIAIGNYRVQVRIAGQEAKPAAPAQKSNDDWGNSLDWGTAPPVAETPPAEQSWQKSAGTWEAPAETQPSAPQLAPHQDFTPLAHELWGAPQARPAPPPMQREASGPAVAGYGALAVNFAPPRVQNDDVWSRFNQANEVNWGAMAGGAAAAAPAPAPSPSAFDADPFAASVAPSPAGADQTWNAFLGAAGLAPDQLKLPPQQAAAAAGSILRRLVAGMVAMLEARARARSEIGAAATVIEINGNNPLKFLRHPDAALTRLMNPPERGFMEGQAAVDASFRDVQAHQMATVAAMQNALRATLARFSPDAIRQRAEGRGLLAKILPAARDAALWQAYTREFEGVVQGSDEAFMDIFSRAFRDAYSRAIMTELPRQN